MKQLFATLALFCCAMLILCSTAGAQDRRSITAFATEDDDGNPVLALTRDRLIAAFEAEFGDGTTVTDVRIETDRSIPGAPYYLVGSGTIRGNSHIMGVTLVLVDGAFYAADIRHSCTGDPCESCKFKKDKEGTITGCDCNGSGKCNHTISTVSAAAEESGSLYGIGLEP